MLNFIIILMYSLYVTGNIILEEYGYTHLYKYKNIYVFGADVLLSFTQIILLKDSIAVCVSQINNQQLMDSSTNFQALPQAAYFLWSCDKVYHKQEVCFLLYFLGQIVSWQYNPNFGLKLTMYSYKWSWLSVVELSIDKSQTNYWSIAAL